MTDRVSLFLSMGTANHFLNLTRGCNCQRPRLRCAVDSPRNDELQDRPSSPLFATTPIAAFGEFPFGYRSHQLGNSDEVRLVDRQLFGPVSDIFAYPSGPLWKISLRHGAPPFKPLTAQA